MSEKKVPFFATAAVATVADGEEDEEDDVPTPQTAAFSIAPTQSIVSNGEEDEDQTEEPTAPAPKISAPANVTTVVSSAVVFEGEADEEDAADTKEAYSAVTEAQPAVETGKVGAPKSSVARKLIDANQATRREFGKKFVSIYDGVKRELIATSEVVNSSLRSAQDVWDMSISANTKLKEIDTKLSSLTIPLL